MNIRLSFGILTELLEASLDKIIGKLTVAERLHVVRCVARGLCYLHEEIPEDASKGQQQKKKPTILHRDLQAANVLISHDLSQVKIADFGVSHILATANTPVGQPYAMAPDVLDMEEEDDNDGYTTSTDVFSFGMLVYHILSGVLPFCKSNGEAPTNPHSVMKRFYGGQRPDEKWIRDSDCLLVQDLCGIMSVAGHTILMIDHQLMFSKNL